ncbi:MAG TPA: SDR family NAD(P)-dependent oxidoreductase, partial [Ktedonobacterales bacterium]
MRVFTQLNCGVFIAGIWTIVTLTWLLNISSIAAVRGGGDMYSAAKAGVIGLTYALAGELAAEGITV